MRDVIWSSLITSLQSGKCVLVLGPDIIADPRQVETAATAKSKSVRDAFCEYLARQLEEENQKIAEPVYSQSPSNIEDLTAFATVNLKNIAAGFFRDSGFMPGPLHRTRPLPIQSYFDDLPRQPFSPKPKTPDTKSPSRYWYHYRGEPRDNRELDMTLSPDTPAIYHLFGTFDEPNSLVHARTKLPKERTIN